MSKPSQEVGYLFINGLGDGATTPKDKVVSWWWHRAGLELQHAHINWYDGAQLETKLASVEEQVESMLQNFGGVAIIGSSAGGSLAVNSFFRLKDKNVCAISAHGRLAKGDFEDTKRNSLHHRAHLGGNKPAQSFYDSVQTAESEVIPRLTDEDKDSLLILTQLTDMVVPLSLMEVEGVKQHRSIAFGHSGGFLAHLIVDRDIITHFANQHLTSQEG